MKHANQIEIDEFSLQYQEAMLNLIVNIQQKEFSIAITAEDQPDLFDIKSFYQKDKGNFWQTFTGRHFPCDQARPHIVVPVAWMERSGIRG